MVLNLTDAAVSDVRTSRFDIEGNVRTTIISESMNYLVVASSKARAMLERELGEGHFELSPTDNFTTGLGEAA